MTPTEFRALRKSIHRRQDAVGDLLGVSDDTIGRIERGEMGDPIPPLYALAVERLAQLHTA